MGQEAYQTGFVKRGQAYGFSDYQIRTLAKRASLASVGRLASKAIPMATKAFEGLSHVAPKVAPVANKAATGVADAGTHWLTQGKNAVRDFKATGGTLSRARPADPAAMLPNTSHLPVGKSAVSHSATRPANITVAKGKPRVTTNTDASGQIVGYKPGTSGGTNPSPLSSFYHEFGHVEHANAMKNSLKANPNALGFTPDPVTRHIGLHSAPGVPNGVDDVLNELGANNAALQRMRQSGASPLQMNNYVAHRAPSFRSYLTPDMQTSAATNPTVKRILEQGQHGYTPDFRTANLYVPQ